MHITIDYNNQALSFLVPMHVMNYFTTWNAEQDRLVFIEQRRSGSYHGRFTVEGDAKLVQAYAEKEGLILPYYGASSASAAVYTLFWTNDGWAIRIEHTVTEATETWLPGDRHAFSSDNDIPHTFSIQGTAYTSLLQYKSAHPWPVFLQQYRFHFTGTTLGAVVWMTDTKTSKQIDLTDYSDW